MQYSEVATQKSTFLCYILLYLSIVGETSLIEYYNTNNCNTNKLIFAKKIFYLNYE